jgi:hypothetical protein
MSIFRMEYNEGLSSIIQGWCEQIAIQRMCIAHTVMTYGGILMLKRQ